MKKQKIFCVGFELPGNDFEYVEFESNRSLLDADIILFEPTLGKYNSYQHYCGKPLIDENDSILVDNRLAHWHSELIAAVKAGKLVIIYLTIPDEAYRHTGRKNYSGTGRNRQVTDIVEPVSSYAAVPRIDKVVSTEGTGIKLMAKAVFLYLYWKEVSQYTKYEVYVNGKFDEVVLQTKSGDRTLGALIQCNGNFLFLPPIHYPESKFLKWNKNRETQFWTAEAIKFGKRLVVAIVGIADSLTFSRTMTPPPKWAQVQMYQINIELIIMEQIKAIDRKVVTLNKQREALEKELLETNALRGLLYEQGKPLETSILEALRIFGFTANSLTEGESEFDAVFTSTEGRFLGEAEGKDSKSINIDKLSQLERNLQEDFKRDDVTEFAKGVLFGNPQRFLPPSDRNEAFTMKCVSGARRAKIALVRTPDLFLPAKYLKENDNPAFAKMCREAIFKAEGEIVCFPNAPL